MEGRIIKMADKGNEHFVAHPNCVIQDGTYGFVETKKNKEGEEISKRFVPCGMAVNVTAVLVNIETAEKVLQLSGSDGQGNSVEILMPREELTELKIPGLTKYGIQVNKKSAPILIGCIENEERYAQVVYQHKRTGFDVLNGKDVFKGYSLIGYKNLKSNYMGEAMIQPTGSCDKWLDMVKTEVMDSPMEIILASAFSAVTLNYVYKDFPVENLIISLVGDSSSGKTTALNLAVSTGALPSTTENSLIFTYLDTERSIMNRMQSGFPVAIDEGSVLKKDITKLLYSIANGKEKAAMTKEMRLAKSIDFHTIIFSSSEVSLFSLADNNSGLLVRVMELSETWTKSGESADKIKQITSSNYGFAVPMLAEYLLKIGKKEVIAKCEKCTNDFLSCIDTSKESALLKRLAKKVGIILATAEFAMDVFELSFNIEMIKRFFANKLILNPDEFNIGIKAHDIITAYATEHPEEFGKNIPGDEDKIYLKNGFFDKAPIKTLYDKTTSHTVLCIKKETFEKVMDKERFRDCMVVLKKLRELGLLESDKGRLLSKFHVASDSGKILVKGYKIRMRDDEVPIEDEGYYTESVANGHKRKLTARRAGKKADDDRGDNK